MTKRRRMLDIEALRRQVETRTDITPHDRKYDGRSSKTRPCQQCEESGLRGDGFCQKCHGFGVVLTQPAIQERARARRWAELKQSTIADLGVTEEQFEDAEYEASRVWERSYEADLEREDGWEQADSDSTPELRYDAEGRILLPKSRRLRRRDA